MKIQLLPFIIYFILIAGCSTHKQVTNTVSNKAGVAIKSTVRLTENIPAISIKAKDISGEEVAVFAETLKGVPYLYGSSKKEAGFDCSGFITYVFNHFKIAVPRSAKQFTNAGPAVSSLQCKMGDLILFTGSNINSGLVGHMGMITQNNKGVLQFIHASSGKGVIVSGMNSYFLPRFVKIIRVFNHLLI
ncbi:MAG: C40 family peptidase [Ferruginibacter sp.]